MSLRNHRRFGVVSSHHEADLSVSLSLIRFPVVARGTASFVAASVSSFYVLFFFFHAGGARNSEAPGKSAARTLITGAETGLATPTAVAAATAAAALGAIARGTRG